mgnify:CR=1 FL=1
MKVLASIAARPFDRGERDCAARNVVELPRADAVADDAEVLELPDAESVLAQPRGCRAMERDRLRPWVELPDCGGDGLPVAVEPELHSAAEVGRSDAAEEAGRPGADDLEARVVHVGDEPDRRPSPCARRCDDEISISVPADRRAVATGDRRRHSGDPVLVERCGGLDGEPMEDLHHGRRTCHGGVIARSGLTLPEGRAPQVRPSSSYG